jgi:hypothetical protein
VQEAGPRNRPGLRAEHRRCEPYNALKRLGATLEGRIQHDPDTLPLRRLRTYRLCRLTGCTPKQLLEESAVDLDWLLAVEDTVNAADEGRRRRSQPKGASGARPMTGGFNV